MIIATTETGEGTSNLMLDPRRIGISPSFIASGFALSQGAVAMLDSIVTQEGCGVHSEKLSARLKISIGRRCNLPIQFLAGYAVLAVSCTKGSDRLQLGSEHS